MITDPLFYLVAIPAVLLFGMSKGGLSGGPGLLAVPLMSLVLEPVQAAAILLPILCIMDLVVLWSFRGKYHLYHLKLLIPAGIAGIVIAAVSMDLFTPDATRVVVGLIAVIFCLQFWLMRPVEQGRRPGPIKGYVWGFIAGFTSTQIHAGGPPLTIYLLPQQLDKVILIGTMGVFFAVINYIKLIPYTLLGQFDTANLTASLILMPFAPVGVRLGYWMLHHIEQKSFYSLLYLFLLLSGCKLVYDGLL